MIKTSKSDVGSNEGGGGGGGTVCFQTSKESMLWNLSSLRACRILRSLSFEMWIVQGWVDYKSFVVRCN